MIPVWLHALSVGALILGGVCALIIVADIFNRPQHMAIMNAVWPLVALFAGPIALWAYFAYGRLAARAMAAVPNGGEPPSTRLTPFPVAVGEGTAHCGAGCTLGDILAEWLCFAAPAIALAFGWRSVFSEEMFAVWVVDYIFAFSFGIAFQYFSIAPMRGLSFWPGLLAALKADTLSLTAWQFGMYGLMAIARYGYFHPLLGKMPAVNTPEFWFTMQIGMLTGFLTSYPVNWWLIKIGIKENM
ncbi:MAG TPA: DUF4396 domain-containing protein [Pseudolabrys sp.]|nr:DUF4396 domain-containing protein [Pseudolabrys sp.]